jgi:protein PhnA
MTKAIAKIPSPSQKDGITVLTLEFDADSDGWFLYGHPSENTPAAFDAWHMTREDALIQAREDWGVQGKDWSGNTSGEDGASTRTRDANGAELADGDTVTLIKDLDVKGANTTLKRGTTIKNIRLTNDPQEIDCPSAPIRGLVLKSCFVKKL